MRYIAPVMIGLIGVAILVALGTWQMQRLDWKQGILADLQDRLDSAPQPLPQMISPDAQKYQPVALDGQIGGASLRVLASTQYGGAGYRIISPFTTNGRIVLLDRGFVPASSAGRTWSAYDATVTGNLHWPDDRTSSTPQNDVSGNIWFARDISQMAEILGTEPLLIVARSVDPAQGVTPQPLGPEGIRNDHLQYAITWFSLALVWIAMTGYWIWRLNRSSQDA